MDSNDLPLVKGGQSRTNADVSDDGINLMTLVLLMLVLSGAMVGCCCKSPEARLRNTQIGQ